MSKHVLAAAAEQRDDVRGLDPAVRDQLMVSSVKIDGVWHVLSRYGDMRWRNPNSNTNVPLKDRELAFDKVPPRFRASAREILWRYRKAGREGAVCPSFAAQRTLLDNAIPFFRHLQRLKIYSISRCTPAVCSAYVAATKEYRKKSGGALEPSSMDLRFRAVEALFELSQFCVEPMPLHPWPESSAAILSGYAGAAHLRRSKTAVIPDDVFGGLFVAAQSVISQATTLLDLRDAIDRIAIAHRRKCADFIRKRQVDFLSKHGWTHGLRAFRERLVDLRTACYIHAASLSGCRNHELAFVQTDSCYSTVDSEGTKYWWMRSRSTKTRAGDTEWMVPEAAVTALRVMDRWAKPYQKRIHAEIAWRRAALPGDPEIAEAERHRNAVFLTTSSCRGRRARTLDSDAWGNALNQFARRHGIKWHLSTHQFRRTFAVHAARSAFGDLRYLKEHFKHWSLDMALLYALNELQELDLYNEVDEELDAIQQGVVASWFEPNTRLAGGAGRHLVRFRDENPIPLYKDRMSMVQGLSDSVRIRSNGHAWCTADNDDCVGNGGINGLRCPGCGNGAIGPSHVHFYQGTYEHLKGLLLLDDIGEAGLTRVRRDVDICAATLRDLGFDPEHAAAI